MGELSLDHVNKGVRRHSYVAHPDAVLMAVPVVSSVTEVQFRTELNWVQT